MIIIIKANKDKLKLFAVGILVGFLNGLLGTGGGSVLVAALQKLGLEAKESHATSLLITLVLSFISALIYINRGYFEPLDFLPFLIPSIIGGFVGGVLLKNISAKLLQIMFSILLIVGGSIALFR